MVSTLRTSKPVQRGRLGLSQAREVELLTEVPVYNYTTKQGKSQIKISYQIKGAGFPPPNQFGGFQPEELDEKIAFIRSF